MHKQRSLPIKNTEKIEKKWRGKIKKRKRIEKGVEKVSSGKENSKRGKESNEREKFETTKSKKDRF